MIALVIYDNYRILGATLRCLKKGVIADRSGVEDDCLILFVKLEDGGSNDHTITETPA